MITWVQIPISGHLADRPARRRLATPVPGGVQDLTDAVRRIRSQMALDIIARSGERLRKMSR